MEIWAIVFSIFSLINFKIVYILPIPKSGSEDLVYSFSFFIPKWVARCSKYCFFLLFFVKLWLVLSQLELLRTELPKCSPIILIENYHLSCFINFFSYDLANQAWFFEKFIFEIETFYSFKITYILVRQLMPLIKNWWCYRQNLFFNFMESYLYSFNPCTASVKMAGTSATVI